MKESGWVGVSQHAGDGEFQTGAIAIDVRTRPSHAYQVIVQDTSGVLMLLRIRNGECYSLDEVGAVIWELCDGARTVSEIVTRVAEEYDVPLDRIQDDVMALLRVLR